MKTAVIDLGFGDSGKGTFTACLCNDLSMCIVVRYSGGHQAGHTVVKDGLRHVFSNFGSGTLQKVPTYWTKNCTFHPTSFLNELNILHLEYKEAGIPYIGDPQIYVHPKCPITTFYDIRHNKKLNEKNQHGSCGVGFGATLAREENYYSLVVGDLLFPSVLEKKLHMIMQYYGYDIDYSKEYEEFLLDCYEVLKFIIIEELELYNNFGNIVYEGSQGLMLDKNIGFFPHVTRANVGSKAIDGEIDNVYYITRAYQTRHGNGPMTNSDIPHNISINTNETNVTNFQGEFRRTLLDLDLLKYAIYRDNTHATYNNLVITCLDHVDNDLRFTYKKKIITCIDRDEFLNRIFEILRKDIDFHCLYISDSEEYRDIKRIII